MHIGFRKDFSKKRRVLAEGAWGGVRDKCKVGSLNIFLHSDYLLTITKYWQHRSRSGDLRWPASSSVAAPAL